ncbi:MAG: dihydropteroate synthase [Acidobacteria bacterium]|nr:dihydropteroate synthase [Acidobacteriota bacterium]
MFKRKVYEVPLPTGRVMRLGERTLVMAILNITPDSFSDGGLHSDADRAVEAGLRMAEEGADILDIGGESTRPGADSVGADEEMRRVLPVIERLAGQTTALLSIDTYKAVVARAAVARGASIINDISGLQYDPDLAAAAAETGTALILMHTRGRSREMYDRAVYQDVVADVSRELQEAVDRATRAGVRRESVVLDPGFGFAKRPEHSYQLLARLSELAALDRPVLSGPSRKSFLKQALGERPPAEREWGTAAAVTASVLMGAHIVRVHDVKTMTDVVRVTDQIRSAARP